jgi:glycosyltransferase involved in cell wall biosynthesis
MGLPRLSIITPSYNQAEFIETTLRSVLDQGYPDLEYQVMDGGSTDGTVDILRRYDGRLRWVSEKDGGQSAALNAGFQRTSGEIIGWINSDDLYVPGALEAVGAHFAAHPEVEWLYGRCPIIDRDGRLKRGLITHYKEFWQRRYSFRRLLIENYINQPAVFFRRRLLDRVGPLEPRYHCAMDYDLWLRMGAVARPAFLDRELARFRVYGDNKMSVFFERSFQEEIEIATRVAAGRHPLLMALHHLNRYKLLAAYKLMAAAS